MLFGDLHSSNDFTLLRIIKNLLLFSYVSFYYLCQNIEMKAVRKTLERIKHKLKYGEEWQIWEDRKGTETF